MEMSAHPGRERLNRKAARQAISRAVRIYWEHQEALPVPDRLTQLAAQLDEVLKNRLAAEQERSTAEPPRDPTPLKNGDPGQGTR
jgi:hypothetical protein